MLGSRSTLAPAVCSMLLAFGAACGDDDEGGTRYQASCDRACSRAHECNSGVDAGACADDCKDDSATIGPNLRADYLAEIDECVAELNCVELVASAVLQTCQRRAAAVIAPSAVAMQLCDAVVDSIRECTSLTVGTGGCLESVKVFNDFTLGSALDCENESCNERTQCLRRELGVDPAAPDAGTR